MYVVTPSGNAAILRLTGEDHERLLRETEGRGQVTLSSELLAALDQLEPRAALRVRLGEEREETEDCRMRLVQEATRREAVQGEQRERER